MRTRFLPPAVVLVVLLCTGVRTSLAQSTISGATEAFNEGEGEHAMKRTVRADLIAERFDDLDRIADQYRRDQSRWPGGKWKLRAFYEALDEPHDTDRDTVDHLNRIRLWMEQRPESITAAITLAISLKRWAWVARGSGTADKVTSEGWRLFNERIAEARAVLESARAMKVMDPQWFQEEMNVGLAQGWDARQMQDMFDRAIQFAPEYTSFYKERANYLLPKWYGEPAEATDFAKTSADRLGGDRGDRVYFAIATVILKRGNGNTKPFFQAMDWTRIQRGYAAWTAAYGISHDFRNAVTYMAYKYNDKAYAQQQFASIGDHWSHAVWKDHAYFERVRDWSTGHTQWP